MKQLHELFSPHNHFNLKYYALHYNKLPIARTYSAKIDAEKLCDYLKSRFPDDTISLLHNKNYRYKGEQAWVLSNGIVFAHLANNVVIHFEDDFLYLCYDKKLSEEWISQFEQDLIVLVRMKEDRPSFSMIKKADFEGYSIADFDIKTTDMQLADNYNDDLLALDGGILDWLKRPNQSGIVLFHGEPGTGKTSYLRYLIAHSKARFIYIPNNLFAHLSDPEFIAFISSFSESVIVLEDCEELLKKRENAAMASGIATLLNLGDGLLGDALKLKIICTFNCPISLLDNAIMRKGRMMYRYEFKKLTSEKVLSLFQKLSMDPPLISEMTLADVYNYGHENHALVKSKPGVGFVI